VGAEGEEARLSGYEPALHPGKQGGGFSGYERSLHLGKRGGGEAGEGAFFMPEQLAFGQALHDGGAVDGNERPVGAGTALVYGAGHQLLAGAGGAGNEHRRVAGRGAGYVFVHLRQRGRFADELIAKKQHRAHGKPRHLMAAAKPRREGALPLFWRTGENVPVNLGRSE
jgi:hypothetical protein